MSDTIVLRKVFALDSNTGLFISSGSVLMTNGSGGTFWAPLLSSLQAAGGSVIGNLPSTVSSFSTTMYVNTSTISYLSTTFLESLCSIGAIVDGKTATIYTAGLGSLGYISTLSLNSTVAGLGNSGYVSTKSLCSTVAGLGQIYISSFDNSNLFRVIGNTGFISVPSLCSTVAGLGQIYISSINAPVSFISTVEGLGNSGYVSTKSLCSTVTGLGTVGYISTQSLCSTVDGLSTFGYTTDLQLNSTAISLTSLKTNIRFDNVTSVTVLGGSNTFSDITNLIYRSTFYQSSIIYSGADNGVQFRGNLTNPSGGTNTNLLDMEFSTGIIRFDSFSSFIIPGNSRLTVDIFPTLAFSKLGTGATFPAMLPISTMLKYGNQTLLKETTTTSYLYAGNTCNMFQSGYVDSSNIFNQPIKIIIPKTTNILYGQPYSIYHYMPSSINNGSLQNALHSNYITPYFGSTGSVFITIQNSL